MRKATATKAGKKITLTETQLELMMDAARLGATTRNAIPSSMIDAFHAAVEALDYGVLLVCDDHNVSGPRLYSLLNPHCDERTEVVKKMEEENREKDAAEKENKKGQKKRGRTKSVTTSITRSGRCSPPPTLLTI